MNRRGIAFVIRKLGLILVGSVILMPLIMHPWREYRTLGMRNTETITIPLRPYHSYPMLPLSSDLICTRTTLRTNPFRARNTTAGVDSRVPTMRLTLGSESYAPSRNMYRNTDKQGIMEKEALAGEVQEGETMEVLKESSARRRLGWVALCWILTWWVPSLCLRYVGRIKRMDIRQAWREKLALNMLIWFICGCAIFVIAVLGVLVCLMEHVFNTSELASHCGHSFTLSPNNAYTSVRGEVFDLSKVTQAHQRVVQPKSILNYGGDSEAADAIFPVQVCLLRCDTGRR